MNAGSPSNGTGGSAGSAGTGLADAADASDAGAGGRSSGGRQAGVPGVAASPDGGWIEDLAAFMRSQPGVGAVRIDPVAHRVSVATVGRIDDDGLRERLAATLAAVEARLAAGKGQSTGRGPSMVNQGQSVGTGGLALAGGAGTAPTGFRLTHEGAATVVGRETCETAEKLWLWREMEWPEPPAAGGEPEAPEWRLLAALAAVCGAAGLAGFAADHLLPGMPALARLLFVAALGAGAWDAVIDTWANLRKREIDIHFLMLAVAAGAVAIGAWGEAVLLLFLFSASGAMEEYALDRTQREVGALLKAAPKRATLIQADGTEKEVAVEDLRPGHRVRVKPGEAFPADGLVAGGRSASDESALTGEAIPVEKAVGDGVFSGTLNLWGAVEFDVTRLPSESTLQKIIRLIHTAQKLRAPSERFTDKFGTGYTYGVIGAATGMFLVWWLGFHLPAFANVPGTRSAFYRAMTLMVVASPCALVLSIPSAILAAIAWGARHGVLFRGGAAIENLAKIDVVALDKTGTLTTGELVVVGLESYPPGRERELLGLASALEVRSHHPIARAVVRRARADGIKPSEVEAFQSLTGEGLKGRVGGVSLMLGRRELLEAGPLADWARNLPAAATDLSEVWVVAPDCIGRILLQDQIREESAPVLAELKRAGIRTVMLTGDRRSAAESIARGLGLDEVRSGLSPEGKVAAIQELKQQGHVVAMVGDGVNDAPCLAAADLSVAMGARGSDAALEQAEVILMHDRIENFLAALRLSQRARRIIRQNLLISLGVVVTLVIATVFGRVPLAVGVAGHEGSTLIVCLNSLRLLFGGNRRA